MKMKDFWQKFKTQSIIRTKTVTFITMIYNFLWAMGKIFFGVFQGTVIYILSGAYGLLLGFCKKIFISNHNKEINRNTKSKIIGILILISGVVFGVWMGRLFFFPRNYHYGLVWSIGIAACSFVELGIAIFNLFRVRRKNDLLLFSLRCCNFTSAMYAIVLTQVAILSATSADTAAFWNAITGIVVGGLAVLIGMVVITKACVPVPPEKAVQNAPAKQESDDDLGPLTDSF